MLQRTAEHVSFSASTSPTAAPAASTMALSGKLALVTGASSGIGLAIAKMFVKEGMVSRVHRPPIIRTTAQSR